MVARSIHDGSAEDKVVSLLLPPDTDRFQSACISYGATGAGKTFLQQRLQKAVGLKLLQGLPDDGSVAVLHVSIVAWILPLVKLSVVYGSQHVLGRTAKVVPLGSIVHTAITWPGIP